MFNKNRLGKYTTTGDKQLQKKDRDHFEQRSVYQAKMLCSCVACMAGKNDKRALYIAFSESCKRNKNLFGVGTKLKERIFKSNN